MRFITSESALCLSHSLFWLWAPPTPGDKGVKDSLKLQVYDDHSGRRLRECFHWVLTATPGETLSVSMSVLPKSPTLTIFTLFARRRTKHTEAIGASRGVTAVKHRRDVMLFLSSSKASPPKTVGCFSSPLTGSPSQCGGALACQGPR